MMDLYNFPREPLVLVSFKYDVDIPQKSFLFIELIALPSISFSAKYRIISGLYSLSNGLSSNTRLFTIIYVIWSTLHSAIDDGLFDHMSSSSITGCESSGF